MLDPKEFNRWLMFSLHQDKKFLISTYNLLTHKIVMSFWNKYVDKCWNKNIFAQVAIKYIDNF